MMYRARIPGTIERLRAVVVAGLAMLLASEAAGANLLLNPGFEAADGAGLATNWWYYGAAGRVDWANRNPQWGGWGNSFFPAGNGWGGFGQDIAVTTNGGGMFVFAISGKAEANFTNRETRIGMEFWAGGSMAYAITQNVYAALDAARDEWVYLSMAHTNTAPGITTVKVRCDFADCTIPGGEPLATCQWDDGRFFQAEARGASIPQRGKFEPLHGVYLGVVLERGGTAAEIADFNDKAGKTHAVYAKFLLLKQDPFPWDWVNAVTSGCPGAALHIVLEPMVDFDDLYAPDWGSGQETYDAAYDFVTNCAHAGVPIFLRFAHEANGDWYPWHPEFSERYGIPDTVTKETYIEAYRNFARLVHSNAPNVAMVWAPNQGNGPDPLPYYGDVYPGDEYVDWVGLSVYNGRSYGNSDEVLDYQFRNAVQRGYNQHNDDYYDDTFEDFYWTFSDPDNPYGHHKPMMLAETAAAFEPKYAVSNELLVAGFESMDGPEYSVSNLLCRFQSLNDDGVVASDEHMLNDFESLPAWNWGPWSDLYFSNSTDRAEGTNAVRLGAKTSFGAGAYVGGNGRSVAATNLSGYDGVVVMVKRLAAGGADPLLTIGLRSAGATATVSRVIVGDTFYPLKISFDDLTLFGPFDLAAVDGYTLELLTLSDGVRPDDVLVDAWQAAVLTNSAYADQDWWPAGASDEPWGDATDSQGGWMSWDVVEDALDGYPTNSVRLDGFDANTNFYIGGNGFSPREDDRDWTGVGALSFVVRRGDETNAEPMLLVSMLDYTGMRTAQVSVVVTATNYIPLRVPVADMIVSSGFAWSNIASVSLEMLSGQPGERCSPIFLKEFSAGSVSNPNELDWWPEGPGYSAWADCTWTQSADAAAGAYSLQISGVVTSTAQWYLGGNGCAIPVARQDWSGSGGLILYAKKAAVEGRVQPKFKITLDNDYAETNGNEAVVETKVANEDWYEMVIAFEDFVADEAFAWTNIRMFKIEYFTGEGGRQPNDLFLDHIRRASVTLTNGADNLKWKHDWCDQLYALESFEDADPDEADEYPDYVSIFENFRNIHMINWFHVKKFEDGFTKDLRIAEEEINGVVYGAYHERIEDAYFLTNIVTDTTETGVSDAWIIEHFDTLVGFDPFDDPDEDGMNNYQEYVAGTDPNEDDEVLEVLPAVSPLPGSTGYVIAWPSEAFRTYLLETCTNLASEAWTPVARVAATASENSYTHYPEGLGPHFYRIKIVP